MKNIYGIDIGCNNIVTSKLSKNEIGSVVRRIIENDLGKKKLKYIINYNI